MKRRQPFLRSIVPAAPLLAVFSLLVFSATAQAGADVNVSNLPGNEAEVSIDVNPTNPKNLVAIGHAPRSQITQKVENMNTFYTFDGGQSWILVPLGDAQDGITNVGSRFDPAVAFDDNGNVYVAYGVNTGASKVTVVVATSANGGQTYTQFTNVDADSNNDKWFLATGPDPSNPSQQNVYITWIQTVSENGGSDQRVVLSASTDGGATFSAPKTINDPSITGTDGANFFPDPAVGPNGELYVAWHDVDAKKVFVDVSLDAGANFGTDKLVTNIDPGFSFFTPPGATIPAAPVRGVRVGPNIDVDRSGGPFDGRLFISYVNLGTGGMPNTDIQVRFSDDSGDNWSSEILGGISDDVGANSQFHPWLDVDQQTGLVSVVWYDARNDPNNKKVEAFMTLSDDGGVTFLPNMLVSDGQTDQSADDPGRFDVDGVARDYLEYISIAILDCAAFPAWANDASHPPISFDDLDFFTDPIEFSTAYTPICNQPPVCDSNGPYVTECQGPVTSVTLDATGSSDPDPGDTLTYSWNTDCPAGSFDDPTSATPVMGLDSSTQAVACNVTLTVTDGEGESESCSSAVTVVDSTPPTITCPADIILTCGESIDPANTGSPTVTDSCDSSPTIASSDVVIPTACPADSVQEVIERTWTAADASGNTSDPCTQQITVLKVVLSADIKPGSCPNPFVTGRSGFLQVALLGEGDFDVTTADVSSFQLSRGDCVGGAAAPNEGPRGPQSRLQDVATPFEGALCGCHEFEEDGYLDRSLKFSRSDVSSSLQLDALPAGTIVELVLSGEVANSCNFIAPDCVWLVSPSP
jgi:hypothetical protein